MSRKIAMFLATVSLSASAFALEYSPIEPIDLPPSVEQGVDMIYIDQELAPATQRGERLVHDADFGDFDSAPLDLLDSAHPLYTDLRRGLVRYQMRWGGLPQIDIPAGPTLKAGIEGDRVALLRERLGLSAGTKFDDQLAKVVAEYQDTHGLKADGIAGAGTIASMNRGADYYQRVLMINLERARRLPTPNDQERYVLVDSGSARISLYENGRPVDSMRAIVGAPETATPMMAALMRYVSVNPYWNVPPELVTKTIAPGVLKEGLSYLTDRDYDIFTDWTDEATKVDPSSVDWQGLAAGKPTDRRFRRGPGPFNSMGNIKYMMPNDFGIYLHDYPDKAKFAAEDRWISNGCVRVEDAARLSKWIFGYVPKGKDAKVEENVDVPQPVPVYMTYITAAATPNGVRFLKDHYGRDEALLKRYFGNEQMAAVN
ncbi:MAG: L,D-transpeptidase family protein [Pseudomonadota bacterium]|nr:L,D-transpeptidase family protein [Pseudomonadota bacterium]